FGVVGLSRNRSRNRSTATVSATLCSVRGNGATDTRHLHVCDTECWRVAPAAAAVRRRSSWSGHRLCDREYTILCHRVRARRLPVLPYVGADTGVGRKRGRKAMDLVESWGTHRTMDSSCLPR